MEDGRILLQYGRFQRSFRVTGETDLAVEIHTGKGKKWIPRKALRMDKQKVPFDGKYRNPYHVLKWFYTKERDFLSIFN